MRGVDTEPVVKARKRRAPNAPPAAHSWTRTGKVLKHSELIHDDLQREIISATLAPGTPVTEKELAQRYGVSRTPAREALLRLAEERLVEVVPKSGTFVSRISLSMLRESMAARKALEGVTVRAAARNASQSQVMQLRAIIQRQQEDAEAGNEAAFHKSDEEFHAALATAGNYDGIWDLILQVKIHIDRYRLLTLPQPGRMQLVVQEHKAIIEAIAQRDGGEAVARMEGHLDRLRLDIAVFRDLWPSYFIYDLDRDEDGPDQSGTGSGLFVETDKP